MNKIIGWTTEFFVASQVKPVNFIFCYQKG